jgi:hypothetical protein
LILKWIKFKEITRDNERSRGTKKWKKQKERNAETLNSRRGGGVELKGKQGRLAMLRGEVEVKHTRKLGLEFY